jgi:hypothetical protein
MWRRPEVFRIFATGVNRLKSKFDIITLSVGSEHQESLKLCRDFGINYCEYPNKPLGAKFNAGMLAMREFRPDYVTIMGSDDLLSTETFAKIWNYCEQGVEMVGFLDLYFFDLLTGKLVYWPGYGNRGTKADSARKGEAIGLGRTLSARVLDKMSWQPWKSDIDMSLDWYMTQRLKVLRVKPKIFTLKENNLFAVDLKSNENICYTMLYTCEEMSVTILDQHLPKNEINLINKFRKNGIQPRNIRQYLQR